MDQCQETSVYLSALLVPCHGSVPMYFNFLKKSIEFSFYSTFRFTEYLANSAKDYHVPSISLHRDFLIINILY